MDQPQSKVPPGRNPAFRGGRLFPGWYEACGSARLAQSMLRAGSLERGRRPAGGSATRLIGFFFDLGVDVGEWGARLMLKPGA